VRVKWARRYDGGHLVPDSKNRRSLTPSTGTTGTTAPTADDVHATRRGGARHEVTSRVTLKGRSGTVLEGWALNVSRGGIRVILEDKVEPGSEFEVTVTSSTSGDDPATPITGRVVWVQDEPDGVIAGIEFREP
jgi:hypothetical protein